MQGVESMRRIDVLEEDVFELEELNGSNDIYSRDMPTELLEDDEISDAEEGFMRGYTA